jgi:hypothetical protein
MIGLLPEDLPFELPIPESSRIIGSIVRGDSTGTEIILDAPLNSEEVISFYHEALIEEGWTVPPEQAFSSGFVSAPWPSQTLCYNDGEVVLYLSALEIPDEPTDVRIHIQSPDHYSVCDPEDVYGVDDSYGLIPSLKPPPGALFLSGGSGSGQDEASATASLKTDLTVEPLRTLRTIMVCSYQKRAGRLGSEARANRYLGVRGPSKMKMVMSGAEF